MGGTAGSANFLNESLSRISAARWIISSADKPAAHRAPTYAPMLHPDMAWMGMLLSSSTLMTPMCTSAFAPPQPRARPIFGCLVVCVVGLMILWMMCGSFIEVGCLVYLLVGWGG